MSQQPPLWHLLGIDELDRATVVHLLDSAARMRAIVARDGGSTCSLLAGRVAVVMFYEPSTRTSSSFQVAMQRLGGKVVAIDSASSSVQKGETLQDTIRVLSRLGDVIVLRHPLKGSAAEAARVSRVPIINAGDGIGEHPSQALLDLFTIEQQQRGRTTGVGSPSPLRVTLLGDLKNGRTVHSLSKLLVLYYGAASVTLHLVSPPQLAFPAELLASLRAAGVHIIESTTLQGRADNDGTANASPLAQTNVLYVTRVQKERFSSIAEYEQVRGSFVVTRQLLDEMCPTNQSLMVMHPLPRVDELGTDLDDDPRCFYWQQVENGVYMRMAVLARVFNVEAPPLTT